VNYERFIDDVLRKEKGFVDHPDDRGGPTNWGITQVRARAEGYDGLMEDMPEAFARLIYRKRYITEPQFDKVALISESIANELIDTGVNMGPARPAEALQRLLNIFNQKGTRYRDVFPDGRIGPVTLEALRKYVRFRGAEGERVMVKALNCLQGAKYLEFSENDEDQESFSYGWFRARINI
jgi:lysozyme family protein